MKAARIALVALSLILGTTLIPSSAHASSSQGTEVDQHLLEERLHHAETVEMPKYYKDLKAALDAIAKAQRLEAEKRRQEEANRSLIGGRSIIATDDLYAKLANCESSMHQVTTGPFHSYFQWMLSTYHSLGGEGMPEDHSYEYQKALVEKIPLSAWPKQFPRCSRNLGIR